jgi:hypothetical protein
MVEPNVTAAALPAKFPEAAFAAGGGAAATNPATCASVEGAIAVPNNFTPPPAIGWREVTFIVCVAMVVIPIL